MTVNGKRLVVVDADEWEVMIEWLETVEDVQIARQAAEQLKAAGGDRERAGWLKLEDGNFGHGLRAEYDLVEWPPAPGPANAAGLRAPAGQAGCRSSGR